MTGTGSFDPALISTLSRKLASLVGPIAPFLVQSAVRRATTLEGLCAELESKVEQPADRLAFHQEVQRQLGLSTRSAVVQATLPSVACPTLAAPAVSADDIERLQTALAKHLGPMARVMVKRAAPGAASLAALKQTLALQIADERDRLAFLRD